MDAKIKQANALEATALENGTQKNRLNADRFILKNGGSTMIMGQDYLLFPEAGQVVVTDTLNSQIADGDEITIEYTYYPLWESSRLNNEESNPVFDGMKIYVKDQPLEIDEMKTAWNTISIEATK